MKRILITGCSGYIGQQLGEFLSEQSECEVTGIDIRSPQQPCSFDFVELDIRDSGLSALIKARNITHVVHLASIVNPGQDEALEYDIDVNGTQNVIDACQRQGVKHLTVTSSGAAYGYYADNPEWLTESDPLRGNDSFSYSKNKKTVETMLADFSSRQNTTQVLIMRPCTVLGKHTRNRITQLFMRKRLLAVGQSNSPFVFIWDQDVIQALAMGVLKDKAGAFNLAGDGKLDVNELATLMNKSVQRLPVTLLKSLLWIGSRLGLSQANPDQVIFLQYRPVLCNERLKNEFGYIPQKTSRQAFEYFWENV